MIILSYHMLATSFTSYFRILGVYIIGESEQQILLEKLLIKNPFSYIYKCLLTHIFTRYKLCIFEYNNITFYIFILLNVELAVKRNVHGNTLFLLCTFSILIYVWPIFILHIYIILE